MNHWVNLWVRTLDLRYWGSGSGHDSAMWSLPSPSSSTGLRSPSFKKEKKNGPKPLGFNILVNFLEKEIPRTSTQKLGYTLGILGRIRITDHSLLKKSLFTFFSQWPFGEKCQGCGEQRQRKLPLRYFVLVKVSPKRHVCIWCLYFNLSLSIPPTLSPSLSFLPHWLWGYCNTITWLLKPDSHRAIAFHPEFAILL